MFILFENSLLFWDNRNRSHHSECNDCCCFLKYDLEVITIYLKQPPSNLWNDRDKNSFTKTKNIKKKKNQTKQNIHLPQVSLKNFGLEKHSSKST